MTKEHPRTNQAVDDTQGQILVYQGSPIGAFFHSNCGGTTEEIQPVWGSVNRPYLPRKKCSYGTADPRYNWKISFNKNDILEALKSKTEVRGTNLKSLKIKKKSLSGRAEKISVVTNQGEYTLSGNAFRIAMHPEKIRSTLFQTFEKHGDGYTFAGRGWGHGVGMCQWGAKGQAENGRNYKEILSFYYPHTELKLWSR
jgi:stage II sporulation protein D